MKSIDTDTLRDWQRQGRNFTPVDTLPVDTYAEGHLPRAINIVSDDILDAAPIRLPDQQATIVVFGKTAAEVKAEDMPAALVPHRTFKGDRPSDTLLAERLTLHPLGALTTLTAAGIAGGSGPELRHDGSTNALIRRCRRLRSPRA